MQALIKAAEDAKSQSLADSVRAMHMKPETTPPPHIHMGGVYHRENSVLPRYPF